MSDIKLLNSQTASNVPSSLIAGQVAINEADGILYYRDAATGNPTALVWGGGSFTGAIQIDAGSGTAPNIAAGLAFESDPDTGLAQLGGANTFSIVAGGTERMRIDSSGWLNLYTDTAAINWPNGGPRIRQAAANLLTLGPSGNTLGLAISTTAVTSYLPFSNTMLQTGGSFTVGNPGVSAGRSASAFYSTVNVQAGESRVAFFGAGTAPSIFLGDVLVGTTTPSTKLTVDGAVTVATTSGSSGTYAPSVSFIGDTNTGFGQVGGPDTASFIANGYEWFRVSAAGTDFYQASSGLDVVRLRLNNESGTGQITIIGYGSNYTPASNTVFGLGGGSSSLVADAGVLGVGTLANQSLIFATNNVERARIDASGRLLHGITTSSNSNVYFNKTLAGSGGVATQLRVGGGVTASSSASTDATYCRCVMTVASNGGTPYSLNQVIGVRVEGSSIHADATVSEQIGFYITSLSGAQYNRAFRLGVPTSGTSTNHNIYADGTAPSYFRGNVGIGANVTSPASALEVNGVITVSAASGAAGSYLPSVCISGDPNTGFGQVGGQSDTASIFTNGFERIRFDDGGKILVGATTSRTAGPAVHPVFQFEGTNAGSASYQCIAGSSQAAVSPQILLARHRGGIGASTLVQDGDTLGVIRFNGGDGTDCVSVGALIECRVSGTPGVNDMPGVLIFGTTPDNGAVAQERMRIMPNGRVGIGTDNPSTTLHVVGSVEFDGPITEGYVNNGNSGTAKTIALTDGTVQNYTLTGTCTFTMPAVVAGQSFTVLLRTGVGGYAASFTGVKWPTGGAPQITSAANKMDILTFISDGTYWYGNFQQGYSV